MFVVAQNYQGKEFKRFQKRSNFVKMSSRLRRKNLGGAKQWHSSGDRETRNAREKYLIYKTGGNEREKKKLGKKKWGFCQSPKTKIK